MTFFSSSTSDMTTSSVRSLQQSNRIPSSQRNSAKNVNYCSQSEEEEEENVSFLKAALIIINHKTFFLSSRSEPNFFQG